MMKVVIAGASGLIGKALTAALRERGDEVRRLVRCSPRADDEVQWNPTEGRLDAAALAGVDAVVNLAGANIGEGRWTRRRREEIRGSRIDATRALVRALADAKPSPRVLVNASATGFYGDRGDEVLKESNAAGSGFLAEVCGAWEAEAQNARATGVRVVCARFGVVLSNEGGALAKMLPMFRLGLGGRLGNGRQWMSWVSRRDAVAALIFALTHERCAGPLNVVAPAPATNTAFTRDVAKALRRPAWLSAPAGLLRLGLGQMAEETVLASVRAVPEALTAAGFAFRDRDLSLFLTQECNLRA